MLYDVSSSYDEGHTCPLMPFGHNRDGKRDLPIMVYGVLTDAEGRPVAVEVYPGNTAFLTSGLSSASTRCWRRSDGVSAANCWRPPRRH